MEPDEWDTWKLRKDEWKSRKDAEIYVELYKQMMERLKVQSPPNSTSVSSNPKPKAKLKVDVTHMSKDVGADILQLVKQTYEDHND